MRKNVEGKYVRGKSYTEEKYFRGKNIWKENMLEEKI